MTPLQFEHQYQDEWNELERLLDPILRDKGERKASDIDGERVAALYRRACEHLALARARAYPAYILDRLERLTSDAHQSIYQHRDVGLAVVKEFFTTDFPRAVRQHAVYVWIAAAAFIVPTLVIGWLVHGRPDLVLSVVDAQTASQFEQMYAENTESIGRLRNAETDWIMFGYYIRNNITVAFQCFAGGLFAGIGSLFFPCLQRCVRRRGCRVSDRARTGLDVFLVRRHAWRVRDHRHHSLGSGRAAPRACRDCTKAPDPSAGARDGVSRIHRHRVWVRDDARHRGGGRSFLVVGSLDAAACEIQCRRSLLDRCDRLLRVPGPPCKLMR